MPEAMMTTLTRFVLNLISRLLSLIEPPVSSVQAIGGGAP